MNLSNDHVKLLSSTRARIIILRGVDVLFKLKITKPFRLTDPRLIRWMERLERYRD